MKHRVRTFCSAFLLVLVMLLSFSGCGKSGEAVEVTAIYAGTNHTIGVKADGTVVAVGLVPKQYDTLSEWTDIVQVAAAKEHILGLKSDGTVVAAGDNSHGQCDVSDWTDIIAIATYDNHTVGLKSDGTVVAAGENDDTYQPLSGVETWTDIVAIATSQSNTFGLRSDGTVVSAGINNLGQCNNLSSLTDVTAIATGVSSSMFLHADGSITLLGNHNTSAGHITTHDFVSIVSCHQNDLALCSDGTFVNFGFGDQVPSESSWNHLTFITAGAHHTVGVTEDGTVLVKGKNQYGECDIENWKYVVSNS